MDQTITGTAQSQTEDPLEPAPGANPVGSLE
jgi:hypothetical protein